jgi:hypothetical protein
MEAPQYPSFKNLVLESMTPEDMANALEAIYKDYHICSDGMKDIHSAYTIKMNAYNEELKSYNQCMSRFGNKRRRRTR